MSERQDPSGEMDLAELQKLIRRSGTSIYLKEGQLAVQWHSGKVDPELLPIFKANKQQLVDWLSTAETAEVGPLAMGQNRAIAARQQQSLWALNEIDVKGAHYALPLKARLKGPLDPARLEQVLRNILNRHQTLTCRFEMQEDQLFQVSDGNADFELPLLDLSGHPDLEKQLDQLEKDLFEQPFDLATGPIFRAKLIRTGTDEHLLFLAAHHIVMDGLSFGILIKEMTSLYEGRSLPSLPLQFMDYSQWQRDREANGGLSRHADFWRDKLTDAPVVHSLPLDRKRPARQSYRGALVNSCLDKDLSRSLLNFAAKQDVTLFTLTYAAFSLLISRHSGEKDLVLGTPVANRERPELQDLIGYFANVLPLRTKCDPNERFTRFLNRARDHVYEVFDHQELSFDSIVETVNPIRNLAHSPLFQIIFTCEESTSDSFPMGPVRIELEQPEQISAKYDLTLALQTGEEGISLSWTYACDLFDRETIQTLDRHFRTLLAEIIQNPDSKSGDLPMMNDLERQTLIDQGIGPESLMPSEGSCLKLFEKWADLQPDHMAILEGDTAISYGDLDQKSNQLAARIASILPDKGAYVAILAPRGIDLILAQLAVMKAGHAFISIDPESPLRRLQDIAEDAHLTLALTQGEHPLLKELNLEQSLDIQQGVQEGAGLPIRSHDPASEDTAYVVFTSGSTGRPKGAAVSHRGFLFMAHAQLAQYPHDSQTVMTVSANVSFDSILWEIWPTLTSGGTLVPTPDEALADPSLLAKHLNRFQPTHFWLPTGLMETICALDFDWPDSIRQVFTGGDRLQRYCLPVSLQAQNFVNIYGPSECSVWATSHQVTSEDPSPVPIGKPLPNASIFILDEDGRLLPPGAVGEIYVGGQGVGQGYLNRPELNEKAFLANPLDIPGHEYLYRTGDQGRWLSNGLLECLGRLDGQVKIRGFRIELTEVTANLLQIDGVSNAFTLALDLAGQKQLAAWLVPAADTDPATLENTTRRELERNLPAYMVPALMAVIEEIPLTPNGKVDRRALIAGLDKGQAVDQVNTASPRDQIELRLIELWQRTLTHPHIGIRDNFFDIGGNSISAIKLVAAINEETGAGLSVADLLQKPSIEQIGELIRSGTGSANPPLIDLKDGEKDLNIICVHPAGGTSFCYLSLARLLPDDVGIFGLQAEGVYPGEEMQPDIPAMACSHIQKIEHLLDRPCLFVGASFGGLLGYEMLRQLADRGQSQVSVAMLDTEGTEDPEILKLMQPVTAEIFREKLVRYNGMYPGIEDAQIARYHQIYNHHLVTQRDYRAEENTGRVILIQATEDMSPEDLAEGRAYWEKHVTGQLLVEQGPGNHATMLEGEPVAFVAKIVDREIRHWTGN